MAVTETVQAALKAVVPVEPGPVSSSRKDIIQLIIEDHNRGRTMYKQYMLPGTTMQQKHVLKWHMLRESSVHAAKEEQVLYPAMRAVMGDLAPDDCLEAHQELKQQLAVLAATPLWDPNHDSLVQEFMQMLLAHMLEEEEELLPSFMACEGVTPEYLVQLGRAFETAKLFAPSRPHPWAPNRPPLNLLFDAVVTPLDFLRDMICFAGAPPL